MSAFSAQITTEDICLKEKCINMEQQIILNRKCNMFFISKLFFKYAILINLLGDSFKLWCV